MPKLTAQTKAILKSWFNVFLSAVITSYLMLLGNGELWGDWNSLKAIVVSGLVAVLPVIKNYLDKSDPRYGRGANE